MKNTKSFLVVPVIPLGAEAVTAVKLAVDATVIEADVLKYCFERIIIFYQRTPRKGTWGSLFQNDIYFQIYIFNSISFSIARYMKKVKIFQ